VFFLRSKEQKEWYKLSVTAKLKYTRKLLNECDVSDVNIKQLNDRQRYLVNAFAAMRSAQLIRFITAGIFNIVIIYMSVMAFKPYDLSSFLLLASLYMILATPPLASAIGELMGGYLDVLEGEIDEFAITVYSYAGPNQSQPSSHL